MSLFEYLAIAFSLVASVTGMRLVAGLGHASAAGRRDGVHLALVVWQLLATIALFWLFWSFRGVAWNFPVFLLVLAIPGCNYFNACALMPESPAAVASWRDYFARVRRRYFLGVAVWMLVVTVVSTVALAMPWSHPGRVGQAAVVSAGLLGASSSAPRVWIAATAVLFVWYAVLVGTFAFDPGSLAP